jgi:hypothetical protein
VPGTEAALASAHVVVDSLTVERILE